MGATLSSGDPKLDKSDDGGPNESSSLTGKGPSDLDNRGCADCLCLIIFSVFLAGFVGVSGTIYTVGDPAKVWFGTDYLGNTCGQTSSTRNKPKLFYPRIAQDLEEQSSLAVDGPFWDINLYGICVASCPVFHDDQVTQIADYGYGIGVEAKAPSWNVYMSTVDLFNRCLPETQDHTASVELCLLPNCTTVGAPCYSFGDDSVGIPAGAWALGGSVPTSSCARAASFSYGTTIVQPGANDYLLWLYSSVSTVKDTMGALYDEMGAILLFGVFLSLTINFMWMVVLYFFAWLAVWASIILLLLGSLLGSITCFVRAGAVGVVRNQLSTLNTSLPAVNMSALTGSAWVSTAASYTSASNQWMYWIGALVLLLVFLIALVTVCCSCGAIRRCIVLVSQGSLAMGSAPGLAVMPIFVAMIQFGIFAFLCFTLLVLTTMGTSGTYSERLTHVSATYQDGILGGYLIFGTIWLYAFLAATQMMTVAGCVFYFYYVNKKTVPAEAYMKHNDDNQTNWPTCHFLGWVLRYHIGTLAFGSAVMAILITIQLATSAIFAYLEQNLSQGSNFLLKLVFNCAQCCLQCFKKTVEFINSYAYIYCFMENVGFCSGCMKTFGLLVRYPAQISINTTVQFVLATLLSLTTPLVCGMLSFSHFSAHTGPGGLMLPGIVVLLAFLMSRAFAAIWEQVIQSLTVMVLHDVDNYDGAFLRDAMLEAFDNPTKGKKDELVKG